MSDFFKNMLGGIFSGKDPSFIGVDIGTSSIKVVQLKKKKGVAVLETYGELALGPYANMEPGRSTNLSSSDIRDALVNLIKESNITAKRCGISIPLKSSLVFTMEMPNVDYKQLSQMIPIEARKYIPVSINEVDLDWKIIPKNKDSSLEFDNEEKSEEKKSSNKIIVLVVAILKDIVAKYQEIISETSLDLKFLEIEIFSTIRSVTGQDLSCFAVLDMGSGVAKLYIVDMGMVKDSHIISRGSQDITLNISRSLSVSVEEAEKYKTKVGVSGVSETEKQVSEIVSSNLEYIFIEANKIILNYQKKYNKNVDRLIITGGGSVVNGILDFAKSKMEIDTELADPFSRVQTPAFLGDLLKKVGPGFAVAVGIALRGLWESD